MARVAGGMDATAAAVMLSDITTPSKPRSPRSMSRMMVGEKTARWSGSILV